MSPNTFRPCFAMMLLAALVLAGPWPAAAQQGRGTPAVAATQPGPLTDNRSAAEIRGELYEALEQYTPALGRVLRLDPTLLQNQDYLASYPRVAALVAQHPQIARDPAYFLERYAGYMPGTPRTPEQEAIGLWREVMDFMGAFLVFLAIASALIYLIRYLVEYRRWHRVTKTQTEVHNKILDRFASNEDLIAYIQTPAGRRFLESAPIAMDAGPKPVGAPFSRILWSVQVGVIVAVSALGLMLVSARAVEQVSGPLFAVAMLMLAIGVGFIVSAGVSYTLSRRMGLIEPPAGHTQNV